MRALSYGSGASPYQEIGAAAGGDTALGAIIYAASLPSAKYVLCDGRFVTLSNFDSIPLEPSVSNIPTSQLKAATVTGVGSNSSNYNVAYGGGVYALGLLNDGTIALSTDEGATFTPIAQKLSSAVCNSLKFLNGTFVALYNNGDIWTAPAADPRAWTKKTASPALAGTALTIGQGKNNSFAVGCSGGYLYETLDFVSYTLLVKVDNLSASIVFFTYIPEIGTYFANGNYYYADAGSFVWGFFRSYDGQNFAQIGAYSSARSVIYAFGYVYWLNNASILYIYDPVAAAAGRAPVSNFNLNNTPVWSGNAFTLDYINGVLYIVGDANYCLVTPDGSSWYSWLGSGTGTKYLAAASGANSICLVLNGVIQYLGGIVPTGIWVPRVTVKKNKKNQSLFPYMKVA